MLHSRIYKNIDIVEQPNTYCCCFPFNFSDSFLQQANIDEIDFNNTVIYANLEVTTEENHANLSAWYKNINSIQNKFEELTDMIKT